MHYGNFRRLCRALLSTNVTLIVLTTLAGLVMASNVQCEELGISPLPEAFNYYRFESGHIVERLAVRAGNPSYNALVLLLGRQRNDWVPDINTYTPSLYFKAKHMYVNCREDMVVVNFRDSGSGRWKQLSNPIRGCRKSILQAQGTAQQKPTG